MMSCHLPVGIWLEITVELLRSRSSWAEKGSPPTAKYALLIIGGLAKLNDRERRDLLEVLEDRTNAHMIAMKGESRVTLQLLWEEYRSVHPAGYGRSQFCELYRIYCPDKTGTTVQKKWIAQLDILKKEKIVLDWRKRQQTQGGCINFD